MSISVSRQIPEDLSQDPQGNLRVIFNIKGTELDLNDSFERVIGFLEEFEEENSRILSGNDSTHVINVACSSTDIRALKDIQSIEVKLGVAQKFQDEFNAEFGGPQIKTNWKFTPHRHGETVLSVSGVDVDKLMDLADRFGKAHDANISMGIDNSILVDPEYAQKFQQEFRAEFTTAEI